MMLQLSSGDASSAHLLGGSAAAGGGGGFHAPPVYQLGLSLEQGKGGVGFLKPEDASGSGKRFREDVVDNRAKNVSKIFFSYFFF